MKNKNIKAATVISTDDTGNFRFAVLSALGKDQKCQAFSPYGLCSNPPDESLAIAFSIQGIAANTVAIIDDPKNRKKGLEKGEVAIVNYLTGAFVHFKEDGSIDVQAKPGTEVKINGNDDYAVRYNSLETRLKELETNHNEHIHETTATIGSSGTPGEISTPTVESDVDFSSAKVETVRLP